MSELRRSSEATMVMSEFRGARRAAGDTVTPREEIMGQASGCAPVFIRQAVRP